ncbi:MAG: DUF1801 domain-containing protein [Candidatus Dojkabacteria bacterium]
MAVKYSSDVNRHLDTRNHPLRKEIDAVREIISSASTEIKERVKWNGPSFYLETKDKEFDFGNINLHQEKFVQFIIVYYTGLPENDHGILQGDWKDRKEIRFIDIADIKSKKEALVAVVKDWIELTNR